MVNLICYNVIPQRLGNFPAVELLLSSTHGQSPPSVLTPDTNQMHVINYKVVSWNLTAAQLVSLKLRVEFWNSLCCQGWPKDRLPDVSLFHGPARFSVKKFVPNPRTLSLW